MTADREKLNDLLRSDGLEGTIARNLMLAMLRKQGEDVEVLEGRRLPDPSRQPKKKVNQPSQASAPKKSGLAKAKYEIEKGAEEVEQAAEAGAVDIGAEAFFTAEEKWQLLSDIVSDNYARVTSGVATMLCLHYLTDVEVSAILAGTATLYVFIRRGGAKIIPKIAKKVIPGKKALPAPKPSPPNKHKFSVDKHIHF